MITKMNFEDWGLIEYNQAWEKQEKLFNVTIQQKIKEQENRFGQILCSDGHCCNGN